MPDTSNFKEPTKRTVMLALMAEHFLEHYHQIFMQNPDNKQLGAIDPYGTSFTGMINTDNSFDLFHAPSLMYDSCNA